MKTILEVLNLSTQFLEKKNFPHPRRQAQDLISRALSLKPMDLYLYFDRPLTDDELERCRLWLARRAKHEPAAYIDGKVEFFGCSIQVSKDVLIPRPETEILVDQIVNSLFEQDLTDKVLLDVCCGSGCLGISLKRRFPQLQVVLSDISSSALAVAKKNAAQNQVEVEFLLGDLFSPFTDRQADFVVCNPPYISEAEYLRLDVDVRDFEPKEALVGGVCGWEFYARLANDLPLHLKRPGKVWLEIGNDQGEQVLCLFNSSVWKTRKLEKDWAGWDRFFFLEIE